MGLSKLTVLVTAAVGSVGGARLKSGSCGVKGAGTSSRDVNISIVNGQDAAECEWKWQVALTSNGRGFCGGMLINPEWVLTAAHCVRTPNFEVVAGEHNTKKPSGNEQIKAAVQVIQHPEYSSRPTSHDFALVRLESPMEFNDCVGSICLPEQADLEVAENDLPGGTECWITGWGTLRAGGRSPDVLQEAPVNIVSNHDCWDKKGYAESDIDDSMLCAQGKTPEGGTTDACQGDSGGPLVCESSGTWTLYGATSWGRGCAGENYPGIWARVTKARDWVDETLDANQGPPPEPETCPEFAASRDPDRDGDCKCKSGLYCSTNGASRNCPSSGGFGAYGGTYFLPTCENCECI